MTPPDESLARRLTQISAGLSVLTGGVGLLVLSGWLFDVDLFTRLLPAAESAKPQTAVTLLLAALSLWLFLQPPSLWRRGTARALATVVLASGLIGVAEYILSRYMGADQLLSSLIAPVEYGGDLRMSLRAGMSFMFLGLALLLVEVRFRANYSVSSWLCVPPLLMSLIAVLGYAYGVQGLYQSGNYPSLALPTSLAVIMLAFGILCARPDRKPALFFAMDNLGGYVARRLIVVALFVPPVLGCWQLMGEWAGILEGEFGTALYTLAIMVILVSVVLFVSGRLGAVEGRLKRQTEINRIIINNAPAAMFLLDPANRVTFANHEVGTMLGWSPEELSGLVLHDTVHHRHTDGKPYPDEQCPLVRAGREGELLREHEDVFFTKDGRSIDVLCSSAPLLTDDGTLASVMIVQDITHLKRAEKALDIEVKRFELLANMIPQFAWSATSEGRADYFNDRWYQYIGALPRGEQDLCWSDYVHPDDVDEVRRDWRRAVDAGEPYEARHRLRRGKDGVYRWFIGRAVPIRDREGEVTRWFGTFTDIEDQHREEERLEEEVADQTAVAKVRAHQVRQLTKELTDAEQRERERLARLLHDDLQQLLVAAKVQVSSIHYSDNPQEKAAAVETHISRAIEAARSLSKELAPPVLYDQGLGAALHWLARSSQLRFGLKVDVDVNETGDPESQWLRVFLFEAVRELLLNVAKHANADRVRLVVSRENEHVSVSVDDSGKGFSVEDARRNDGTCGSGLIFIQNRTALIGGSVEIDSAPGKGSRITITVPVKRSPPEDDDVASVASV